MAQSSVMVSLSQMVDLAFNCPAGGTVNFNILYSLLHVLIQQVDVLNCKVEFTGKDGERIQNLIARSKPGHSLDLTEYIVTPTREQLKVLSKKPKYKDFEKEGDKDKIIAKQEIKAVEEQKSSNHLQLQNSPPSGYSKNENKTTYENNMQIVVTVEQIPNSETSHVAGTSVKFIVEKEIEKLKEEIEKLKEVSTNEDLIRELKNNPNGKSPILDMLKMMNLSKRIDAVEIQITKLASMFEDLARQLADADGERCRLVDVIQDLTREVADIKAKKLNSN